MAKHKRPATQISLKGVPAPDAPERLRQGYDLILRAAARAEGEATEENAHAQDGKEEIE